MVCDILKINADKKGGEQTRIAKLMNKGQKETLDKLSNCDMKKIDAKLAGKIKKILDEKDPKLDSEEVKS